MPFVVYLQQVNVIECTIVVKACTVDVRRQCNVHLVKSEDLVFPDDAVTCE